MNVTTPTTAHGLGARNSVHRGALPLRSANQPKVSRTGVVRTSCISSGRKDDKSYMRYAKVPKAESAVHPYFQAERTNVETTKKCKLITAIKTPYLPDGRFDLGMYDRLVEEQIAAGVEGLIVGGTTGEGHLMSWDEHIMLIAHTAHTYGEHLHVIGNTGSNSTKEAVHASQQGFAVGMDASLQINPYYGKTSHTGLIHHFNAVLEEGPVIVYNVPSRTGQDIPPNVVEEIAQHPNFAGVKECMGNERIKGYTDKGITCWTGNDDEAHDAVHEAGARGVISVTSNITPKIMRKLMDEKNPELAQKVMPLMNWLFAEPNPIGLNTLLMMGGHCEPVWRLPYVPMSKEQRAEVIAIINELGMENTVFDTLKEMDDSDFTYLSYF
eukprot:CAMPEP_0118935482 /NCGR_PEP_ID=MMETSP1169-20130426/15667_1 /TAXON_ID=36882 /ORGANISM="Pyramimonas obovata, Strain CCMP722" /LENGTH=381 /DNA_ID=CAMNT_0006878527 /DNA_START=203 /DNA_END=1348 /DNA_ORIENTATION=-